MGSGVKYLQKYFWYERLRRAFWGDPDRLLAIKVTIVLSLLVIPFMLFGKPFYAITLALGALAGALSETDDHPRGRIKSMAIKVISFALASFAVELLRQHLVLLGIGLSLSTIIYILIGGISERYRGITFGSLLIGIYAMIGADISPVWYIQPILLTGGALFYGLFSLILLCLRPWRLLEEQLARGFMALSNYLDEKAKLFPSDEKMQQELRTRLSLLNVQTVNALDTCKEVLNSYGDAINDDTPLKPFLQNFMVLQSLHERAASSHERYDLLSNEPLNRNLIEGIGQTLHQLSTACLSFTESLLTGVKYLHPVSLTWMVNALNDQLKKHQVTMNHPLVMLVNNLSLSNSLLKNINDQQSGLFPRLEKDTRSNLKRLKNQLSLNHPRLRYALRLSFAFAIGFTISEIFNIAKGEWIILTILFVLQPSYSATRRRLFQRTLGTLSGVVSGILLVQLLTPAGQLIFMLLSAFIFMLWMKRNYSVAVIFITTFVLFAFNLISNKGIEVMQPRIIDTLIGAALAYITVRLLWPDWQSKHLPGLLRNALLKNTAYLKMIIEEYQQPATADDLDYRIARREAHRADNALVLAWQNIQLEPRKQQQFRKQAFTLTYLNHALLSYISAFGAHRKQEQAHNAEMLLLANEILNALQEVGKWLLLNNNRGTSTNDETLNKIRQQLQANTQLASQQHYGLLNNLAEVAGQMLEQAKTFQLSSSSSISRSEQ